MTQRKKRQRGRYSMGLRIPESGARSQKSRFIVFTRRLAQRMLVRLKGEATLDRPALS